MKLSKKLNEELEQLKNYLTEWLQISLKKSPTQTEKNDKVLEEKYRDLLLLIRETIEQSKAHETDFDVEIMEISDQKEATSVLQKLHEKQRMEIATIKGLEEYGVKLEATCKEWEKKHQQKLPNILEIVAQNQAIIKDLKSINRFVNERLDAVEVLQKDLKKDGLSGLEQKKIQEVISVIEHEIDSVLN